MTSKLLECVKPLQMGRVSTKALPDLAVFSISHDCGM